MKGETMRARERNSDYSRTAGCQSEDARRAGEDEMEKDSGANKNLEST